MKNSQVKFIFIGLLLLGSYFIMKYDSVPKKNDNRAHHIGYFVNIFKNPVKYSCENQLYKITDSGEFHCPSFPISFYMNSTKLGEISSIHSDGYVFPQDMIVLESFNRVELNNNILVCR